MKRRWMSNSEYRRKKFIEQAEKDALKRKAKGKKQKDYEYGG